MNIEYQGMTYFISQKENETKNTETDINNNGKNPYEDWYVYPDLVDMDYVNEIKNKNINNYKKGRVTKKFRYNGLPNIKKSMNWKDIEY